METRTTTNETRNGTQSTNSHVRRGPNGAVNGRLNEHPFADSGKHHEPSSEWSRNGGTRNSRSTRPHGVAHSPSTPVECPYWYEEDDVRFGLREWFRADNGDIRRRKTASVSGFDGTVVALGSLAERMADCDRLPDRLRERLWFYSQRLLDLPGLVDEAIAEWNGIEPNNGNGQATS